MKTLTKIIASIYLLLVIYDCYIHIIEHDYKKLIAAFIAIVIFSIPIVINKFINTKKYINLIYYFFFLLSYVLGGLYNLYGSTLYFDKLVHFLFGFLFTIVLTNDIPLLKRNIIIIIALVMLVGLSFEFMEFFSDYFLGTDHQRKITGSADTMMDLLVALFGSLIYITGSISMNKIKQ